MNQRHLLRRGVPAVLGALTLGLGLLVAAPATAATAATAATDREAAVDLQPQKLTRGPDIAVPHVEGRDFVDGDRRVRLPGVRNYLVGASGNAWIVGTSKRNGGRSRVFRLKSNDTLKTLLRGVDAWDLRVSEDGQHLVGTGRETRRATDVRVYSPRTGALTDERSFRAWPEVLGMDGDRVLITRWDKGVTWWNTRTGRTRTITRKNSNVVDISTDLMSYYTKDPFNGGCVKLTSLSDPGPVLWKSCDERIDAISPDGARMATIDLLSDGVGPGVVWERTIAGDLLGTYETGWFGAVDFETETDLLLEVNGVTKSSTVRCSEGACENATDPVRVRTPRLARR